MHPPKLVILLLVLSAVVYANEFRYVNGYIVEFNSGNDFELALSNESDSYVDAVPLVQIYRGNSLYSSQPASNVSDSGYNFIKNDLPPGRYEIRPIFTVENKIVAARFSYENKGNILDQIISFFVNLIFPPKTTDVHEHADLAVYLDGHRLNLSQAKYMENSSEPKSELVHLHDMNGNIIHKHAVGATLGIFFGSLGMEMNSTCFTLDKEYCNLKMFVNGSPVTDPGNYEPHDLDRILITAGNYSNDNIPAMISSVSNDSCIESNKCPGRGTPSNESECTTEGGCKN